MDVLLSSLDCFDDTGDQGDDEADGAEDLEERPDFAEDANGLSNLLTALASDTSIWLTCKRHVRHESGCEDATLNTLLGLSSSLADLLCGCRGGRFARLLAAEEGGNLLNDGQANNESTSREDSLSCMIVSK